jgi:urease subunit gamma/beta
MAERKWSPPPIPKSVIPKEAFDVGEPERCGQIDFAKGDIEINAGRASEKIVLVNTGDRPIQIGAHYHLAECNRAMAFDRQAAFGMRLDIPSGTAIRFEPGQSRKVQITEFAGRQVAYGMNNMTNGTTRSEIIRDRTMRRLREEGYCFEGERFPISPPADKRFKGKKTSGSRKKS